MSCQIRRSCEILTIVINVELSSEFVDKASASIVYWCSVFLKLKMILSKSNKCICPNWKTYFSKWQLCAQHRQSSTDWQWMFWWMGDRAHTSDLFRQQKPISSTFPFIIKLFLPSADNWINQPTFPFTFSWFGYLSWSKACQGADIRKTCLGGGWWLVISTFLTSHHWICGAGGDRGNPCEKNSSTPLLSSSDSCQHFKACQQFQKRCLTLNFNRVFLTRDSIIWIFLTFTFLSSIMLYMNWQAKHRVT